VPVLPQKHFDAAGRLRDVRGIGADVDPEGMRRKPRKVRPRADPRGSEGTRRSGAYIRRFRGRRHAPEVFFKRSRR